MISLRGMVRDPLVFSDIYFFLIMNRLLNSILTETLALLEGSPDLGVTGECSLGVIAELLVRSLDQVEEVLE